MELLITDRLHKGCIIRGQSSRLLLMRRLSKKEIAFARKAMIRRYYLPSLNEYESAEFFKEFDKFWDQVIKPFGTDHPFWRNVVSSKMQEWEQSVAYLTLVLFTLAKKAQHQSCCVIIVCSSLEEEKVCEEWGKGLGWKIKKLPHAPLPFWLRLLFREIKNLARFVAMSLLCFYKKAYAPKYVMTPNGLGQRILIASLLYSHSLSDGKYLDPFFGNIHDRLKEKGYRVTYVSDILDNFRASARKVKECRDVSIIIPYSLIPWIEFAVLLLRTFFRRYRLYQARFCNCDFSKIIRWRARSFDIFFNLHSEIYYAAISRLCRIDQFVRLIHLFEGNAMERACIQAFRKYCPCGEILGYNHTVLYPFNLKLRLTSQEKLHRPEPDKFVSAGSYSMELLQRLGNRNADKLRPGCSLKSIPRIADKRPEDAGGSKKVLVATGGTWSSAVMLDFLFEHVNFLSRKKVILRGHPNVQIESLLKSCVFQKPDQFEISNSSLAEDLGSSFCVIYRETSVGMQALLNGVPVIHLRIDSPLISDTLFEYSGKGKWTAISPEELETALKEAGDLSIEDRKMIRREASGFIEKYITPPTDQGVLDFLQ